MKTRILTAIVMGIVIVPTIYFGNIPFLILGTFLSIVAGYEMMHMFYTKYPKLKQLQYIVPFFCGSITVLIYLVNVQGVNYLWLIFAILTFIIFSMGLPIFIKDSSAENMLQMIMTVLYCGILIGYVMSIRYLNQTNLVSSYLPTSVNVNLDGLRLFAYLYLITVATDIFAYFFGSKFGKRKLAPAISPKKSVEGGIAGLVFGTIFGTAFAFLTKIVVTNSLVSFIVAAIIILLISMIISFMVQLGDLVASKLKRTYEIKDFGKIFPGHGGVLDRFDSLLFAGGFFYCIILIVKIILL